MFLSITDFDADETDDSHIMITIMDSMGQTQGTKRFDQTNYDVRKWIQDGFLLTLTQNITYVFALLGK